jgi:hypothetical protein
MEFTLTEEGVRKAKEFFRNKENRQLSFLVLRVIDYSSVQVLTHLVHILNEFGHSSVEVQNIKYTQPIGHNEWALLGVFAHMLPTKCDLGSGSIGVHIENVDQQQLHLAAVPGFTNHIRSIKLQVRQCLGHYCWSLSKLEDLFSQASNLEQLLVNTERGLLGDEDKTLQQLEERGITVEKKVLS